jgi:hypothetical protein
MPKQLFADQPAPSESAKQITASEERHSALGIVSLWVVSMSPNFIIRSSFGINFSRRNSIFD